MAIAGNNPPETRSPAEPGTHPLHLANGIPLEWLDQQYNPIPLIADPKALFGAWEAQSAATRTSLACKLDIPYGEPGHGHALETLDVFPAARRHGDVPAPVLVFVHGGYWRGSDKNVYSFIAAPFVEAGITVVMPNYPLCPAVAMEQIPLSLTRALAWVHANIAEHGGDAARITVAGHSAGGHLSAMLASCHWQKVDPALPADLVRKALCISGLFELEPFRHAPFLAPTLKLDEAAVNRLSPARFPAPPAGSIVYAVVGGEEPHEFQRQNRLLQEAWGRDRVPVCEAIPDRTHFTILNDLLDEGSRLQKLVLDLVAA